MKKLLVFGVALATASAAVADFSYAQENEANRTPLRGTISESVAATELDRAIQSGDLIGLHGVPFNRMSPYAYPPKPVVAGRSRLQVQADLARAIREGDMLAANETGLLLYQQSPTRYARVRSIDKSSSVAQRTSAGNAAE